MFLAGASLHDVNQLQSGFMDQQSLTSSTVSRLITVQGLQLGPSTYLKLRSDYMYIKYEATAAAFSLYPEKEWDTLP